MACGGNWLSIDWWFCDESGDWKLSQIYVFCHLCTYFIDACSHLSGRHRHFHAGICECLNLLRGATFAASDNGAGVTHPSSWWRRHSSDERCHWLFVCSLSKSKRTDNRNTTGVRCVFPQCVLREAQNWTGSSPCCVWWDTRLPFLRLDLQFRRWAQFLKERVQCNIDMFRCHRLSMSSHTDGFFGWFAHLPSQDQLRTLQGSRWNSFHWKDLHQYRRTESVRVPRGSSGEPLRTSMCQTAKLYLRWKWACWQVDRCFAKNNFVVDHTISSTETYLFFLSCGCVQAWCPICKRQAVAKKRQCEDNCFLSRTKTKASPLPSVKSKTKCVLHKFSNGRQNTLSDKIAQHINQTNTDIVPE